MQMTQDLATYYVWIGGSCDYGHKERAGGAAVVIELMEQREQSGACSKVEELDEVNYAESRQKKTEGQQNGKIISKDVIADLHTTEFFLRCAMKASKGRASHDAHAYGQGDE